MSLLEQPHSVHIMEDDENHLPLPLHLRVTGICFLHRSETLYYSNWIYWSTKKHCGLATLYVHNNVLLHARNNHKRITEFDYESWVVYRYMHSLLVMALVIECVGRSSRLQPLDP